MFRILVFFFIYYFCVFDLSKSNGDLTRQNPLIKKVLLKGEKGEGYYFEPSELKFKTGKLYNLQITNVSDYKHYFTSIKFSKSIFTRKVQLLIKEKKVAEIKGVISEVEIFPSHTLEWWFVPIKTGIFNDLTCEIIDKISKRKHSEIGMNGTIIIE